MHYYAFVGRDSDEVLWDLVSAATSMHVLRAFVVIGVPDAVPENGIALVELAAATHAPPDRLRRFLRAASGLGLCDVSSSDICTLTPSGALLRSDAINDVRILLVRLFENDGLLSRAVDCRRAD